MNRELISNVEEVTNRLLEEITDYEEVTLTTQEQVELKEACEGCRDDDEVECEMNKYLIKIGFIYNSNKFYFERLTNY